MTESLIREDKGSCQNERIQTSITIAQLMQADSIDQSPNPNKLQHIIKTSILKIKSRVRKLSLQFLKTKKLNHEKVPKENVEQMVELFSKASSKVIETFFVIVSNEEYLQFESESSIKQKLSFLKRQVSRSCTQTMKRALKTVREIEMEQEEQVQQKQRAKAKNCKIAAKSTVILQKWLTSNFFSPYPSQKERQNLAKESGIDLVQVNNWFINKREKIIRKYLKKDGHGLDEGKEKEENSEGSKEGEGSDVEIGQQQGSVE